MFEFLLFDNSILLELDCCVFACLSGLYLRDRGIETEFIFEIKTNFQMLL